MSPEESDNSTRATAIVAPVAETPEGDQPGTTTTAAAVPVASATPITSDTTETKAESVKPVENSEGTDKPAEDKPAEDKPAKDKPAEKPADDKANEAKDESEKESNLDHEPPRTPPARDNYQQPSQYNYPPPARQGFLNVPQDLPYPFFLHNNFLMIFIFLGMLFILIGGILSGSAIIAKNYDIYGGSIIAISIGLFTISTFLTLAGLFRKDLNQFIRFGFLVIGGFAILGIVLYSRFGAI